MHIYRPDEVTRVEPPGHFGHLEVSDVVSRDIGKNHSVQLSYCPPGGGGEMHWHDDDAQLFLVIEGQLSFDTGNEKFTLQAPAGVMFEPGEHHATLNESTEPSVTVVVTVTR